MTDTCLFCKGPHNHSKCPMFGTKEAYFDAYAPKPFPKEEAKPSSPLPLTRFEQIFGKGAEELLQEVVDHPDLYTHDEVNLAWVVLSGAKKIKDLDREERNLLDQIAVHLSSMKKPAGVNPPERRLPERRLEDDEGPPRDAAYEELVTRGLVDPSDG